MMQAHIAVQAAKHAVGLDKHKHNAFDLIDEIFQNLNSKLNMF